MVQSLHPASTSRYTGWTKDVLQPCDETALGCPTNQSTRQRASSAFEQNCEASKSFTKRSLTGERGHDGREKRRCSDKDLEIIDLTEDSPPSSRRICKSTAVPSKDIAFAPIFLRQGSQLVNPEGGEETVAKDISGYKPLTFRMPRGTQSKWWTHELYRGPGGQKVKIEYCETKEEMEKVAKTYLPEPIVGFDMEWYAKAGGIKGNISLIQVGCEDRIALFHIAMFKGKTINELVSPSLRKLVESPNIIKTGSAVYAADGKRLKRFMHLEPRGFLELGHLHRVVMFANSKPSLVNNSGWALAKQVKEHFGIPMSKGPVRCSNWTKKLDKKQIVYAASDAYAGYMLYRVMELRRVAMCPVPPKPAFAELFLRVRASEEEAITRIPASTVHAIQKPELVEGSTDSLPDRIFEALRVRRKWFAKKEDVPAYEIAMNATLKAFVAARPTDTTELSAIAGMTEEKIKKYGSEWLRILKTFPPTEENVAHPQSEKVICDVVEEDGTLLMPFKRPADITPSPPTTSAIMMASLLTPTATLSGTLLDLNQKRALSVLKALRIRMSLQHNLARDFIQDGLLQEIALSHAQHTPKEDRSPRFTKFHQVLARSNIDLEQFLDRHAPRSSNTPISPTKVLSTLLTPVAERMSVNSREIRAPLSAIDLNLTPPCQASTPISTDAGTCESEGMEQSIFKQSLEGGHDSEVDEVSDYEDDEEDEEQEEGSESEESYMSR